MVDVVRFQLRHERRHVLWPDAETRELALRDLSPGGAVVGDIQFAEPRAHLGAIARRDEIPLFGCQPVAARRGVLASDDLDDLAIRHLIVEWHDAAVHLRAPAAMA